MKGTGFLSANIDFGETHHNKAANCNYKYKHKNELEPKPEHEHVHMYLKENIHEQEPVPDL